MTDPPGAADPAGTEQLQARIAELEDERRHLVSVVEILEEISGSLNFVDILQNVTNKVGELYGLDRCSIFLADRRGLSARLVASYEDPTIRNHVVNLEAYPELQRALRSGETVFIPDAQADPNLKHIRANLAEREVKSITVVPISWRGVVIGAMFLRSFRDGPAFTDADIKFCRAIGRLAAKVLRTAYQYQQLSQRRAESSERARRANLERVALVAFMRRLLASFSERGRTWSQELLSATADKEIERLADVAMTVIAEEGKGR